MVCEVRNGVVVDDPHTCGGQNQGGGVNAGFNKYWNGWPAVYIMNAIAQKYVDTHPQTSQAEAVKPNQFLVIARGKVVHVSDNVESCKDCLNKNYGRGVALPQRMVCEVRNGVVVDDPHTCGGQNQGGGVNVSKSIGMVGLPFT